MTKKSKMLHRNLIVLMCNLPWEWSTDYTNQTATLLSKNNIVICYMLTESYSIKEYLQRKIIPKIWEKKANNLYLFYPLQILPFRRLSQITRLNNFLNLFTIKIVVHFIFKIHKLHKKILWVFDPQFYLFYRHFMPSFFTIYDCVDYFAGNTFNKVRQAFIKDQEIKLLKSADFVVTISHTLKKIHSKIRDNIHVVPQGFRLDLFKKYNKSELQLPHEKPIIGYVGGINFRLDYNLLLQLAKLQPYYYTFVFIGPVQEDSDYFTNTCLPVWKKLLTFPNILWYDSQPKQEIPGIIAQFDIGMIPYNSSLSFNRFCYPMKLFEYFYVGKSIVSTHIEELTRFPKYVKIAKNIDEWNRHLALYNKRSDNFYINKEQRKISVDNSWENKISAINDLVSKSYESKNKRNN